MVSICPARMPENCSCSVSSPTAINIRAMLIPAVVAMQSPRGVAPGAASQNTSPMPRKAPSTVRISCAQGRLRSFMAVNSSRNTGPVYWSTMALAAVVSLLATTKASPV